MREIAFGAALLKAGPNVITLRHADAVPFARFDPASRDRSVPANTTPGQAMDEARRLDVRAHAK
ncbi:hypothetical protein [Burkholderia plantarii]|uniref:hypothetical protein n=1 Tax=Burkholderia plantarii TaxID=41899 RepID=UPI0005AEE31A|nr:hypothetical protein [Burkholderia plantarii]